MTHSNPLDYSGLRRESSLTKVGGGLAIAGCMIGMAIFVAACFGFGAAFSLSFLPLIFGGVGLILCIVGGFAVNVGQTEPTQVLASIFVSIFSIIGGLLLMAIWLHWTVLPA